MRAACKYLAEPDLEGDALLAGLASAAGVFYNFSGQNLDCFDWSAGPNEASEEDTDFWGYQWCAAVMRVTRNSGSCVGSETRLGEMWNVRGHERRPSRTVAFQTGCGERLS